MPEMNGFETARLIKSREKNRLIPIIFVTAYGYDPQFIAEGYQSGAVDYLTKPFDALILRAKVAIFAEMHRRNRALREAAQKYRLVVAKAADQKVDAKIN